MTDIKRYMAVCSEKTLQSNAKGFFLQFSDTVQHAAGKEWIQKVFAKLKTDRERIRIIYHDPTIKDIVLTTLSHVQEIYRKKSAEVSIARRTEAQKTFLNDEITKSLTLLSQAVLRSPKTGENRTIDGGLSLCHGLWARSEVLMRLNKYDLALLDIQLAMKEALPDKHKAEAFWRLAICYKALNEDKKCQVSRALAIKLLNNNGKAQQLLDGSLRKEYKNEAKRKKSPLDKMIEHAEFKGATCKFELQSAPNKGRYVIAREHMETGELVIQEEAYVSCLLPDCFGTHCHHCYERLEAPVGCPECSSVAFCCTECRDKALGSYHQYECRFLDLLIGSGMSILAHVALRMITQRPIDYLLQKHKEIEDGTAKGVYNLCTLNEFRNPDDFLQRTLMAAFLLRCLQKCGYFGYVDENVVPNENQLKIGEILLYNLQMLQFNAHEIYETKLTTKHRFQGAVANYIGVAVYPTAAMLNHDCCPTVTRHFVGKHIVLRTCKPIKAGQEISDNYGPNYSRKSLQERQKYLKGRYWFECKCAPCKQNWPTIDALDHIDVRIKCPFSNGGTACDYFFTLPSTNSKNEKGKCPRCRNKINKGALIEKYQKIETLYYQALAYMETEQVREGIICCCAGLNAFYEVSAAPHKTTQLIEESLRALYADSGNVWEMPAAVTNGNGNGNGNAVTASKASKVSSSSSNSKSFVPADLIPSIDTDKSKETANDLGDAKKKSADESCMQKI